MGEAVETVTGLGPVAALVDESMTTSLALVKEPRALVSTEMFAVNPAPLLSLGEATAWFEIITRTLPSAFLTGNTSMSVVSVLLDWSRSWPEPAGNIWPSQ